MKPWVAIAALAALAAAVPQDDMKSLSRAVADLKKSVECIERRLDAVETGLRESARLQIEGARREAIGETRALLLEIQQACETYRKDHDEYPSERGAGLAETLAEAGPGGRAYIRAGLPTRKRCFLDRWGHAIRYQNNTKRQPYSPVRNKGGVDLWSVGPNGDNDSGECDDIGNW